MDRREQRSAATSRVGTLHGGDGSFDRQFRARIPAAERLALVWDMTLESLEWRRQSGAEPRRLDGAGADNAPRVYEGLRRFGAPPHELTIADLVRAGTIFEIGVPPDRIDVITAIDGVD